MKVQLIDKNKEAFKHNMKSGKLPDTSYKLDVLHTFQKHWDLSELDLKSMVDKSFSVSISGRLWGGSFNSAKSSMLTFIDMNKEFVRSMFRDLMNESIDVTQRVKRFVFHCDQLLLERLKLKLSDNVHFNDERMASLYLALRYPEVYTLFDYPIFATCMNKFESRQIPAEFEIAKYFLLCRSIKTILKKDEDLINLYGSKISFPVILEDSLLFLVHAFLEFVADNN